MQAAQDEKFMRAALREAGKAAAEDEVPVGAVVVCDGRIIARAHNRKERYRDALRHAETEVMHKAQKKIGDWRLTGCTLYVTLEPCAMCAGAALNCRLDRIVYGAQDKRFGCCGTLYSLPEDARFNHVCAVTGGILGQQCADLLSNFFKAKREKK